MPDISVIFALSAFAGGIAMFLAPCTFPLVPAFLASMVPNKLDKHYDKEMLIRTLMFSLGFTVVFTTLGLLSGVLGASLIPYKTLLLKIGAVAIIVLGLSLMGAFNIPYLNRSFQRLRVPVLKKDRYIRPSLVGVVFALGWSPCAGPILVSILLLASQTGTALEGGILLAFFSLGLAVPFILIGSLYAYTIGVFKWYEKYHKIVSLLSGGLLVALGATLLVSGSLLFANFGYTFYEFFGIAPMCMYY